jgi:hypothetical protein
MALVKRTCQNPACGREFEVMLYPCDAKSQRHHNRGKFCSAPCRQKARTRTHLKPPNWKGGRVRNTEGRIGVWVPISDPLACMTYQRWPTGGYVLEHRLVMARALGRPLTSGESGDPGDNRIENLQLRMRHHGQGQAYCCADCGSRNVKPVAI